MKLKQIALATSIVFLTACASTPPPEPEPVVRQEAPAPRPVAPTPREPVAKENLAPIQQYQGPIAGSINDFVYVSGGDARIYFGYDQFDLAPGARDVLRRQAEWLNRYPQVTAVVEGNADERGTREYNLALGARRADSVKAFLVSLGVSPNRLTTVSYGKERPIDGRSSEEGWARNRNGHTNLMSGTVG